MAAFDFPNNPAVGDRATNVGIVYIWDGQKWVNGTTSSSNVQTNCVVFTGPGLNPMYECLNANSNIQISDMNKFGRVWITQDGSLGVGTATPAFALDVVSIQSYTIRAMGTSTWAAIVIDHAVSSGGESLISFRSAGVETAIIEYDSDEDRLTMFSGQRSAANSVITCDTNSRCGIGTTNPTSLLTVSSAAIVPEISIASVNTTGSNNIASLVLGTSVSNFFIQNKGTIDAPNGRLAIIQAGVECLTILPTGNVGIGQTVPSVKLDVWGNANVFAKTNPTDPVNNSQLTIREQTNNPAYGLHISYGDASYIQSVNANAGWTLSLNPNGGYVGIGTPTPGAPLDVRSNIGEIGYYINNASTNNTQTYIFIGGARAPGRAAGFGFVDNIDGASGYCWIACLGDNPAAAQGIIVKKGGNVGLGLVSPVYMLQLSADLAAKPSTSSWIIASDIRTKQNVQRFEGDIEVIRRLNPTVAEYNGKAQTPKGMRVVSFDPDELKAIVPQCVTYAKGKLDPKDKEETDIAGINTHEIFFHLLRAVQQIDTRVQKLETK